MKINRLEHSEIHRKPYIPKVERVEKSQDKRWLKEHSVKDSNINSIIKRK